MDNNQMSKMDIIGLGFMTFAFFLGAGNLIFPPFAGMMAGENIFWGMLGFIITAVGMPLISLIAVAKTNGNVMGMLPPAVATLLAIVLYIIIGPAFGTPRTGLVAYEMGLRPFLSDTSLIVSLGGVAINLPQLISTLIFFSITLLLALFPGKLLQNIGKVLTPVLIVLLLCLSVSMIFSPSDEIGKASGDYIDNALFKGIIEGYNTMDTLASVMFGMLIIDLLRKRGIHESTAQTGYLIRAALIAAAGLAFVYISLFFLGASAGELAIGAENGGQILTNYVTHQFGGMGTLLMSTVVVLACLTTAVGLISACADFFSTLIPRLPYRLLVVVVSVICVIVANVGLTQLIKISIPVLIIIYPVIIALVMTTFMAKYFIWPQFSQRLILGVTLVFSVMDGLSAMGLEIGQFYAALPLQAEGMAWLLPTCIATALCLLVRSGRVVMPKLLSD